MAAAPDNMQTQVAAQGYINLRWPAIQFGIRMHIPQLLGLGAALCRCRSMMSAQKSAGSSFRKALGAAGVQHSDDPQQKP